MNEFSFDASQTDRVLSWTAKRISDGPDPRHGAQSAAELDPVLGGSITEQGLGAEAAFKLFTDVVVPTTRPFGHPSSLSFVASAPTQAALSFDAALGAAGIFAFGTWVGDYVTVALIGSVAAMLAAIALGVIEKSAGNWHR